MRAAAALVLGLFLGFIGAMVQTFTPAVAGVRVPVGMALALVAVFLVARACAWWSGSRLGAVTFSVGWLAATLMMGTASAGGDLVLSSGTRQMAYLILGTIALSACCGYPLLPEEDTPAPRAVEVADA
jgi:Family of unknown function (DUF6113)